MSMCAGPGITKVFLKAVCILVLFLSAGAADNLRAWELSLEANALVSSNVYVNWVGSEASAVTWTSQLTANAGKNLSEIVRTENGLKLSFGETYLEQEDGEGWMAPKKAVDLIDAQSTLKFTFGKLIDPYIAVRIISQFWDRGVDDGYDLYINPVEFTESFGGAVDMIKEERITWNTRVGGAFQEILNRRFDEDSLLDVTGGFELTSHFNARTKSDLAQFTSQLRVYEAVIRLADGDSDDTDWRYPDVNWENTLSVNVLKYVMLSAYVQVLYDREVRDPETNERVGTRFKNTFSVGLTYSFESR